MLPLGPKLDVLFVSERAVWPTDQGFAIRGSNMAMALARQGLAVRIASIGALPAHAPDTLRQLHVHWPTVAAADHYDFLNAWSGRGCRLRHRLAEHQGRDLAAYASVVTLVRRYRPSVVIGLGLHAPMMLRGVEPSLGAARIWYAADELIRFELSCLQREGLAGLKSRLHKAGLYAAIENAFARGLEGAVGVSPAETRWLKLLAGVRHGATIRNGVDLDYFQPRDVDIVPQSLVFWGRMDFAPNIDAVTWFARKIWPTLKRQHPRATWSIVGKAPVPRVTELARMPGITVTGAVDDIRDHAACAAVTLLPMQCGGGIKNKLLEAAAMGLPIVASPLAVAGLQWDASLPPALICRRAGQWVQTIGRLWREPALSRHWRHQSRRWAEQYHNWDVAARDLVQWLEQLSFLNPTPRGLVGMTSRRMEAA
ncbi:MAG: glycosyltransferase [Phycisphaeraceae bacterium]|nr:glycosyltransferase [Phycisphaeraceae bacterium]